MAAVKLALTAVASVAAWFGAIAVGTAAATWWYERVWLPRIAGEE